MDKNYLKREIKTLFFFLIPYMCMEKDKIWKKVTYYLNSRNKYLETS